MAAVFTKTFEASFIGGFKLVGGTLAMDSSYPTNGETVDLSSYFPGGSVQQVGVGLEDGYVLVHDGGTAAAGKVKAFYFDYDAVADGAGIEVANATDLSGITACSVWFAGN